jgi:hypothetical protein
MTYTRIGVTQALNRHVGRVFESSRKGMHWGRRKLKRDQWGMLVIAARKSPHGGKITTAYRMAIR